MQIRDATDTDAADRAEVGSATPSPDPPVPRAAPGSGPRNAPGAARRTLGGQVLASIRTNFLSGMVLWAMGVLIVAGYYAVEPVRAALERVAELKSAYGLGFSMVSTAMFGGVIPLLVLLALGRLRDDPYYRREPRRRLASLLAFGLCFWAYKGAEVDLLYRGQAWLWGEGTSLSVIVPKVLVDQFVYVTFYAGWSQTLVYMWKDRGFRLGPTWRAMDREFWCFTAASSTIANWALWIPAVTCIYLMPSPLQLPAQNLVLCFFVLMLNFLAGGRSGPAGGDRGLAGTA